VSSHCGDETGHQLQMIMLLVNAVFSQALPFTEFIHNFGVQLRTQSLTDSPDF
jgi:hypothetical protein